jgi:ribosomal protein L19E
LGVDIILLRVSVCVVIILNRCGEEEVWFLKNKLNQIRFCHTRQQVS